MSEAALRFLVSGRVQGVFFRASTRQQAERLALRGHAINLDDGRVEVIAAGLSEDLNRLEVWLWKGPPAARVDAVEAMPWDREVPEGFRTG
ncbi:MAG: acylphosphatase [Pseudomonadota bacterium]